MISIRVEMAFKFYIAALSNTFKKNMTHEPINVHQTLITQLYNAKTINGN